MTLPAAGETGLKERTWRGEAAFHSRIACSYRFVLLDFGSEESKGHSSAGGGSISIHKHHRFCSRDYAGIRMSRVRTEAISGKRRRRFAHLGENGRQRRTETDERTPRSCGVCTIKILKNSKRMLASKILSGRRKKKHRAQTQRDRGHHHALTFFPACPAPISIHPAFYLSYRPGSFSSLDHSRPFGAPVTSPPR